MNACKLFLFSHEKDCSTISSREVEFYAENDLSAFTSHPFWGCDGQRTMMICRLLESALKTVYECYLTFLL